MQASTERPAWQRAAGAWLQTEVAPLLEHYVACAFPYRRDPAEAALVDGLAAGPATRQAEAVGKFVVSA